MSLKPSQIRYLRGLAHALKPLLQLGNRGVTASILEELDRALTDHELVKVRLSHGDRATRATDLARLAAAGHAESVQTIGRVAVLYRRNQAQPRIALPA